MNEIKLNENCIVEIRGIFNRVCCVGHDTDNGHIDCGKQTTKTRSRITGKRPVRCKVCAIKQYHYENRKSVSGV